MRYCVNQKQWYIFDRCKGWIAEKNSKILDIYQRFIRNLAYAYNLIDNDDYRKAFGKFFKCTSISTCDNILRHAAKYYPFDAVEMDAKIDIVAAHNGVIQLDLANGTFHFRSFHPDDMTTKRMSVTYDPDAKCPRWEQFVGEVMDGNAELITFLQIFSGQMMYGRNEQKAFGIFLGVTTNNGKSTLVEALKDLLGDYAVSVSESVISKGNNNQINELEQLAKTQGARMVSLPEPRQNLQLNEQVLKSFTGNGLIHVRRLYQEGFDIQPGATLIIDTNYELTLRDMSVFHRKSVILFPFNVSFSENQIDTRLFEKLRAESSGILNWILKGWEMYCALTPNSCQWTLPARMQQVINEYAHDSDIIHRFIEDNYQITANRSDVVPMAELYQRYRTWSLENGDSPGAQKILILKSNASSPSYWIYLKIYFPSAKPMGARCVTTACAPFASVKSLSYLQITMWTHRTPSPHSNATVSAALVPVVLALLWRILCGGLKLRIPIAKSLYLPASGSWKP